MIPKGLSFVFPRLHGGLFAGLLVGLLASASAAQEQSGPGPVPVDVFHPDHQPDEEGRRPPLPEPAWGGRAIVHMLDMPQHLNKVTENSGVVTWIQYAIHDHLAEQDWESWEFVPRLATGWETEDSLVLKESTAEKYGAAVVTVGKDERRRAIVWGDVHEAEDHYLVTSSSAKSPLPEPGLKVARADVVSHERGTVFTFHLRDGIEWHDGHPFDARDVWFSWDVYNNPEVDCDQVRAYYVKILEAVVLDPLTIRFFYEEQYFKAQEVVCGIPLIARHLYDLTDPDNRELDPETHERLEKEHGAGHVPTLAERGAYVNENPRNTMFVGLGPYRITGYDPDQYIEAERWDGYHDAGHPRYGGYLDTVRWRYIRDDNASKQALLNGELDFYFRLGSADYFGEMTKQPAFTDTLYKGYIYTGAYNYLCWNLLRPHLEDKRVRQAIAHAFDLENWRKTKYRGLAKNVTGPQNYFSLGYNREVEPFPHDPARAEELLVEAGWYDRDGDGVVDRDGVPLEIEFLHPSGNTPSRDFGTALQEALAKVGVRVVLRNLEWATFQQRILEREFDAVALAWNLPLESDPEQLWHSTKGQPDVRSSNHAAVMDDEVDRLIEAGQRELDEGARAAIWRELHAYLYDLQPYLWRQNAPRKFAMNKRIRGMQIFQIAPGYDLRRWYYPAGTEGTRPVRARGGN